MTKKLYKYGPLDEPNTPNAMKLLYRLRQIIVERKIFLSSPYQFNDPFEWQPWLCTGKTVAERERCREEVRKWEVHQKLNPSQVTENVEIIIHHPEYIQNLMASSLKNYGVSCFTEYNDDLLMWAHYTNNHLGYCLEFDFQKASSEIKNSIREVRYLKTYPKVCLHDNRMQKHMEKALEPIHK